MICLVEFYKETGFSRTMFGEVAGVSTDTLRKYEWSNTDHMRKSTIEKIEGYAQKALAIGLHIKPLYFGNGWIVRWGSGNEVKISGWNHEWLFIRYLLDGAAY